MKQSILISFNADGSTETTYFHQTDAAAVKLHNDIRSTDLVAAYHELTTTQKLKHNEDLLSTLQSISKSLRRGSPGSYEWQKQRLRVIERDRRETCAAKEASVSDVMSLADRLAVIKQQQMDMAILIDELKSKGVGE